MAEEGIECVDATESVSLCLFCDASLNPGSQEHVFLSALGGRLISRQAICVACYEGFAKGDKIDDSLSDGFRVLRCALMIWSGRDHPPPTIGRAGRMDDGSDYDLAPGFIPILSPVHLPNNSELNKGGAFNIAVRNLDEADKVLDILNRRGLNVDVGRLQRVSENAPGTNISIRFDGPKVWRSLTKTALTGACVMYGNAATRSFTAPVVREAAQKGTRSIEEFACWDYSNPWPVITSMEPHKRTPDAQRSGFEHYLVIADVTESCVAYISIFSHFRFFVWLGTASGKPPRGLALNPRSAKPSRFDCSVLAPTTYGRHDVGTYVKLFPIIAPQVTKAFEAVLSQWQKESHAQLAINMRERLEAFWRPPSTKLHARKRSRNGRPRFRH